MKILTAVVAVTLVSTVHAAVPARMAVTTFPLSQVQLLDSPFKQAMERNARYLLELDPDRLLHNTRQYAGLKPKGELYGGWESQGIAGHTLGHYLTALSQQYAATGDRRYRERIDYIIGEMAECQRAYGDGYIGALPTKELETLRGLRDGKVEVKGAFNFANDAWVPWYTEHKVLAGLKDAWVLGGNEQAKDVTLKLADWVGAVTSNLTPEQLQTMLSVEHGGMREVLVEIYALTGNEKYLETSRRFYHHAVLDPLREGRDELPGRHANTQIPKVTGAARSYEVTGDEGDRTVALDFWKHVVRDHSWVIGGNSDGEHFFSPNKASEHLSAATAETCNTYNMLKLTEHLFSWQPSVEYADYYERALYNHILASQDPERGMYTYFMSLKPGHFRTYSTPFESFWCCVGSGMENHTKYGEAIYFHGRDDVFVNLFIPSRLEWQEKQFVLEQHTDYPRSDTTELLVRSAGAEPLTLRVRAPAWAAKALTVRLNGKPVEVDSAPGNYVAVSRTWKKGDRLVVTIPMTLRTEALHGAPDQVAFLYGPLVLAGDLGPEPPRGSAARGASQESPVLVAANRPVAEWLKPVAGAPGTF
ncbi:MAG TPA: glycoside hydrolase family 127 protein, partial [Povalibacter sp.]|nr:glycoside hydrolase family 127 protein [Povalibacter sp.]